MSSLGNTINIEDINIESVDLVAFWDYTAINKECLCNRSLQLPTKNEIDKNHIFRNNIVFGKCGHAFHFECLNNYLKTYGNICPHDQLNWEPIINDYKIKYTVLYDNLK
jgi:hypothetical protein